MTRLEPRRWNPSRQYEPSSWLSRPVVGLALIIGSTLGIVCVSFFGPSAVTLSLGPRYGSLLPPWYIPSTWNIALGDWTAVMATYVCIALGAVGMWILIRAPPRRERPDEERQRHRRGPEERDTDDAEGGADDEREADDGTAAPRARFVLAGRVPRPGFEAVHGSSDLAGAYLRRRGIPRGDSSSRSPLGMGGGVARLPREKTTDAMQGPCP